MVKRECIAAYAAQQNTDQRYNHLAGFGRNIPEPDAEELHGYYETDEEGRQVFYKDNAVLQRQVGVGDYTYVNGVIEVKGERLATSENNDLGGGGENDSTQANIYEIFEMEKREVERRIERETQVRGYIERETEQCIEIETEPCIEIETEQCIEIETEQCIERETEPCIEREIEPCIEPTPMDITDDQADNTVEIAVDCHQDDELYGERGGDISCERGGDISGERGGDISGDISGERGGDISCEGGGDNRKPEEEQQQQHREEQQQQHREEPESMDYEDSETITCVPDQSECRDGATTTTESSNLIQSADIQSLTSTHNNDFRETGKKSWSRIVFDLNNTKTSPKKKQQNKKSISPKLNKVSVSSNFNESRCYNNNSPNVSIYIYI